MNVRIKEIYNKLLNLMKIVNKESNDGEALWYHNFSRVGLKTVQRPGIYENNQLCKELIITSYLLMAMEYVKTKSAQKPSVLELFCADGYYSNIAASWGAGHTKGIDKNASEIILAKKASRLLGNGQICEFVTGDVYDDISQNFDIVLCAGGLYHIANPKSLLAHILGMSPKYLICQSVVTLATDDENYFESPAPGWTWGCRFTSSGMKKMLCDSGWEILQFHENELIGNSRIEDRGSVYALCCPIR